MPPFPFFLSFSRLSNQSSENKPPSSLLFGEYPKRAVFTLLSFNDCDKREGGVLYLYDEYKRFLTKKSEDGLSKLDKVKLLIFCETRQHLLSKYLGLEMIRLNDKKYSEIRNILKTIYRLDKEIIKISSLTGKGLNKLVSKIISVIHK